MPRVAIIIETPALVRVGLPIITEASYDIGRDLDAAGTWAVEFPSNETLAAQVRTRWRVSIVEEGRPGYLLRRGIVTDRQFNVARDGSGMLHLAGFSRLFGLAAASTHLGLNYVGIHSILDIAAELAGEAVLAPSVPDASSRRPVVTFNDTSKLSALLSALEYARMSIRETFDEDSYELTAWDDVPDSGYKFVTVDLAGADLDGAAAAGMGLIAGTPRIGYNGRELATRVIPAGVDHDGTPLTLVHSTRSLPYAIQSFTNPNGSLFYYLEDANAVARAEVVELQLVRSDIKNPNDDSTSRMLAANALYDLAAGTLLQRKSDVIAFSAEIGNGAQVEALPGDRVRIQFRGRAAGFGGASNYWSLDQWFLVVKRRDVSTNGGVRGVSFTLTAPEIPLRIPTLPEAVPIPPPPSPPPDPPAPTNNDDAGGGGDTDVPAEAPLGELPGAGVPPDVPVTDLPIDVPIPPPGGGRGNYQPCCPTPENDVNDGTTPPPDNEDEGDIVTPPGGLHWESLSGGPPGPADFDRWVGMAVTNNVALTGTNVEIQALGEVFLTHGGSVDNTAPTTVRVYGFRVTGPGPTLGPTAHQRWAKANGSLEGHTVEFDMVSAVAEESFPFPLGSSNFPLEIGLSTPGLPDNKAVGLIHFGHRSGFNLEGFSAVGGYEELVENGGVGPLSVSNYIETTMWSPDNTPFLPRVCMWSYAVEVAARITS